MMYSSYISQLNFTWTTLLQDSPQSRATRPETHAILGENRHVEGNVFSLRPI